MPRSKQSSFKKKAPSAGSSWKSKFTKTKDHGKIRVDVDEKHPSISLDINRSSAEGSSNSIFKGQLKKIYRKLRNVVKSGYERLEDDKRLRKIVSYNDLQHTSLKKRLSVLSLRSIAESTQGSDMEELIGEQLYSDESDKSSITSSLNDTDRNTEERDYQYKGLFTSSYGSQSVAEIETTSDKLYTSVQPNTTAEMFMNVDKDMTNQDENIREATEARYNAALIEHDSENSTRVLGLQDTLSDQSEKPLLNNTGSKWANLEYLQEGHCASSPGNSVDYGESSTDAVGQLERQISVTADNVMLNISEGGAADPQTVSPQVMVINKASSEEKMEKLKERTEVILKTFQAEERMPTTLNLTRAMEALKSKSRIVVLVGPKNVKTKYGKYLLLNAVDVKYKLMLRYANEWECLDIKKNMCIFIDNLGGVDRFEMWAPYLDEIYGACTYGNVSAIFGMEKKVFERYLEGKKHMRHRILSDKYMVDVNEEQTLSDELSYQEVIFIALVVVAIAVILGLYLRN